MWPTNCSGSSPLPRPHWLPHQGRLLWGSVLLIWSKHCKSNHQWWRSTCIRCSLRLALKTMETIDWLIVEFQIGMLCSLRPSGWCFGNSLDNICFAGMHLLPEEVEKLDGAANFRQVFIHLIERWLSGFKRITINGIGDLMMDFLKKTLMYWCSILSRLFCFVSRWTAFLSLELVNPLRRDSWLLSIRQEHQNQMVMVWKKKEQRYWGWCWLCNFLGGHQRSRPSWEVYLVQRQVWKLQCSSSLMINVQNVMF